MTLLRSSAFHHQTRHINLPPTLLWWLAFWGCGGPPSSADSQEQPLLEVAARLPMDAPDGLARALGAPVNLEGRNLVLAVDGALVEVTYLSGRLIPVGDVVDLQSPASFEVRIDSLEVVIPEQTIESAMWEGDEAPFTDLTVRTEGQSLVLQGHGGALDLPFSFRGTPRVTPDGTLAIDLERVGVLGIGVKGFIGAFQGAIESALNKHGHLIGVDRDQLCIDPFPFRGPPEIAAAFTSVEVREHELVARLGDAPAAETSRESEFVLSGGALRSGKMIFFDVPLRLVAKEGGTLVVIPMSLDDQLERGFITQAHDGAMTIHL